LQDTDCVTFLQWAMPQMKMRWAGFRKVHKRVCKRLVRRLSELGLDDLDAYRHHLSLYPEEWQHLDSLCRVVVTRFYRDKRVFTELAEQVLPQLAREAEHNGRTILRAWSIGSASGEEAYTLAILWHHLLTPDFAQLQLSILGTEVEPHLIERSHRACYPVGTIKNLPAELRTLAFTRDDDRYCLKPHYQPGVEFRLQDIRRDLPDERFDLILCRNLVFTYFDESEQQATLERILTRLRPGGWLLLGVHETLPAAASDLEAISGRLGLYRYG
jgi:chemotaxis protein methyltransferase CheR